jgi:hypothetical protein
MIQSNLMPCTDWVQKLAARHPDDLLASDRIALNEHLALCPACSEVHTAYKKMEAAIHSLPLSKPMPVFSYQHSRLERNGVFRSALSLSDIISFVVSVFSSLFITTNMSNIYQILRTWFVTTSSFLSHKIAYVSSNSHYTYAMRSDSGFILWQQKRYQKHNLGLSVPVRLGGMSYIGGGIAYVSALDFCRYTAQA